MSKDTPTPAALREAVARQLLFILQEDRLYPPGAWEQYDATTQSLLLQNADRILALLPLDPGEAPAPLMTEKAFLSDGKMAIASGQCAVPVTRQSSPISNAGTPISARSGAMTTTSSGQNPSWGAAGAGDKGVG